MRQKERDGFALYHLGFRKLRGPGCRQGFRLLINYQETGRTILTAQASERQEAKFSRAQNKIGGHRFIAGGGTPR